MRCASAARSPGRSSSSCTTQARSRSRWSARRARWSTHADMKILFIGDIVGPPGIDFLQQALPLLRKAEGIDLAVANAENAAGGSGITARLYRRIRAAGVDLITLGDHVYKKAEFIST